jgi:Family of unknown function (DUF6286)
VSRSDARSNKLRRRPARTTPASIVSVVVLAVGVGLVWITVLRLLNGRWPRFLGGAVNEWLATLTWGSTITVAISLAAVAVGLILLFCAWKPGQPNAIVLHVDGSGDVAGSTEFVITRRSVARLAAGHADLVDGVDSVSATVRSRRITLSVKSQSAQRSQLAGMVTDRVREALQGVGLQPMPKITTTVHTQRL